MPSVTVGNVELAYEEIGTGQPLLLIMGIGANLAMWHDDWCGQLAARGFRVIRFDNRDVGKSSQLDALGVPKLQPMFLRAAVGKPLPPPYSITNMAGDAAGLLAALGIRRAHVVGMSMGGMIAQQMAVHYRGAMASVCSIMSTTGSRRFLPRPSALRALLQPPRSSAIEDVAANTVRVFKIIGGKPARVEDEQNLWTVARAAAARGGSPAGYVRQLAAVLAEHNRTTMLQRVHIAGLVVHGEQDPLIPIAAGRATAKALHHSTFLPVAQMGHDLPRRHWPQIIDAICSNAARGERAE